MKLFHQDGPLMDALRRLTDLMFCNMMFCLLSLPLVTAGAALCALYDCTLSIVQEQEDPIIVRQFWRSFRKHFKQATLLWLLCLAAFLFLGVYYVVTGMLTGQLGRVYRVTFFLLLLLFLFGFQYLFPLRSQYTMKTGHLLKNAWLLSAAALPCTLATLGISAGMVYVTLFMNPAFLNMAVFLWALLLFAVTAYLNSFFFLAAFRKVQQR